MPPYTAGDRQQHAAVATDDTDASACVLVVTNSGRAQKNVLAGCRKAIVAGRRKSYCSGRAQINSGRAQINSGRAQKNSGRAQKKRL